MEHAGRQGVSGMFLALFFPSSDGSLCWSDSSLRICCQGQHEVRRGYPVLSGFLRNSGITYFPGTFFKYIFQGLVHDKQEEI